MKAKLISLLLLATLVSSLFAGCSRDCGNTDNGGQNEKIQPTELIFKGYFSDTEDISIELIDYDLTLGKQDFVLNIKNESDTDYYFYGWFDLDKKGDYGWEGYNISVNSAIFDYETADPFPLHVCVKANSEFEFSTYHDMIKSDFSLDICHRGTYRLRFRELGTIENSDESHNVGITFEIK